MAITKCKECGHEVSTTAGACPNCGARDFLSDDIKKEQRTYPEGAGSKRKVSIGCLVGLFLIGLVLIAITVPAIMRFRLNSTLADGEAEGNLFAIRTAQEGYFIENGVYLECRSSPPNGGTSVERVPWLDAGGFSETGFEPDGSVRHQYAVMVSDDGQSFVATATGDVDEDGEKEVYMIDKKSDVYPEVLRTGDWR